MARDGKSRAFDPDKLAKISDAHARVLLRLQEAFGLRCEEAMKL